jgi:hypothetical protein
MAYRGEEVDGPLSPSAAEALEGGLALSPSPIGSGQADGEREENIWGRRTQGDAL